MVTLKNLQRSAVWKQWAEIHVFEDHDEIDTEVVVAAAEVVVVVVVCVGSATVFVADGDRYSSCRQVFALLIYDDNFEHNCTQVLKCASADIFSLTGNMENVKSVYIYYNVFAKTII